MVPNDCHTLTRKKTAGRKTLGRRAVWVSGTKPLTQNPAVGRAVWVSGTKPFTQNPAVVRADIVLLWLHGPGHELDASLKGKAT